MNNKIQVKTFKRESLEELECIVNKFLEALEYEPKNMTFGNSFEMVFDGDYEGDYSYYPTHTAVIEYLAVPGNVHAVEAFNETSE